MNKFCLSVHAFGNRRSTSKWCSNLSTAKYGGLQWIATRVWKAWYGFPNNLQGDKLLFIRKKQPLLKMIDKIH